MNAITGLYGPASLTEALEPEHGVKARALAAAYDSYCVHHSRVRFASEVRRINACRLIEGGRGRG